MPLLPPSPTLVGRPTHALTFARYGARAFAVASAPPPPVSSSSGSAPARPVVRGRASPAPSRRSAVLPAAAQLLQAARDAQARSSSPLTSVRSLVAQAAGRDSAVLPFELAYESTPARSRRVDVDDAAGAAAQGIAGVGVLAVIQSRSATASLAFAVGVEGDPDRTVIVAAEAPKADETTVPARNEKEPSLATLISNGRVHPVTSILSSLQPWPNLYLLHPGASFALSGPSASAAAAADVAQASVNPRTLPVSPYPAPVGTRVRFPVWDGTTLDGAGRSGWSWVEGEVALYRDLAGNVAKTGTYDQLAHMLIDPPPPAAPNVSTGAPVLDANSGAVVGVLAERRAHSTIVGRKEVGWAVPAERLFEGFLLPGLGRKK